MSNWQSSQGQAPSQACERRSCDPGWKPSGASAVDLAEVPGFAPFDAIVELVGGPNLEVDVDSLAVGGRIADHRHRSRAARPDRPSPAHAPAGSPFRIDSSGPPLEERAAAARLVERQVVPLVAGGLVRIPIEPTFAFEDVQAAYARFEAGSELGKIVLEVPADG